MFFGYLCVLFLDISEYLTNHVNASCSDNEVSLTGNVMTDFFENSMVRSDKNLPNRIMDPDVFS